MAVPLRISTASTLGKMRSGAGYNARSRSTLVQTVTKIVLNSKWHEPERGTQDLR
jgi:hypothetical protein